MQLIRPPEDVSDAIAQAASGFPVEPDSTLGSFVRGTVDRLNTVWGSTDAWFPSQFRPEGYQHNQTHVATIWVVTMIAKKYDCDLTELWMRHGLLFAAAALYGDNDKRAQDAPPVFGSDSAKWALMASLDCDARDLSPEWMADNLKIAVYESISKRPTAILHVQADGPPSPVQPFHPEESSDSSARDIVRQLETPDALLEDNAIHFINRLFAAGYSTAPQSRIMDPVWMQVNSGHVPGRLRTMPPRLYIPLHWRSPDHWTLGVADFHSGHVKLHFYDSLGETSQRVRRPQQFLDFFARWLESINYAEGKFKVELYEATCPQQTDGHSCGVFVLSYIQRLLSKQAMNDPLDGAEERLKFLNAMRGEFEQSFLDKLHSSDAGVLAAVRADGDLDAALAASLQVALDKGLPAEQQQQDQQDELMDEL